jgi:hypothetical protein
VLNERMTVNDEMEIMWKQLWPILRYYPRTDIEGLRKTMKNLYQNNWLWAKNTVNKMKNFFIL